MSATKSPRIFENPVLETVSRSNPVLNTAVGLALAGACLARVDFDALGLSGSVALVLATIFAWTLIEYLLHRYFFHWTPKNPSLARALYLVHQYHHDFPNERSRNMFPLAVSLPTALLAWLALWVALPLNSALLAFATIVVCFTYYDLVHYVHHLPTTLLPGLRRRHMLHHFRTPEANYGVTTSFWDRVFGTLGPEPETRAQS